MLSRAVAGFNILSNPALYFIDLIIRARHIFNDTIKSPIGTQQVTRDIGHEIY